MKICDDWLNSLSSVDFPVSHYNWLKSNAYKNHQVQGVTHFTNNLQ